MILAQGIPEQGKCMTSAVAYQAVAYQGVAWLRAMLCCCALALAAVSVEAIAEDAAQGPTRNVVWLQDPWTGKSVQASYPEPDQSLWDATQIKDYEAARQADYPPPLGVLFIDDLNIQVPVYNGTDEHILERGAGRIKGMAKISGNGKLGISAHRDSFFRGLKDIEMGDEILLQSPHGVEKYAVSDIKIIPKDDTSVLAPVDHRELMLVTCYPFYHVGAAPERFIVTALPATDPVE